jgi:hypothetical protein
VWESLQPSDNRRILCSLLLLAHRSHRDVPCGQASALLQSRAVRNRASHQSSHLAGALQHQTSLRIMLPSHQPEAPLATVRPRAPAVRRSPPTACFQSNDGGEEHAQQQVRRSEENAKSLLRICYALPPKKAQTVCHRVVADRVAGEYGIMGGDSLKRLTGGGSTQGGRRWPYGRP